jgi:hypothetical protein
LGMAISCSQQETRLLCCCCSAGALITIRGTSRGGGRRVPGPDGGASCSTAFVTGTTVGCVAAVGHSSTKTPIVGWRAAGHLHITSTTSHPPPPPGDGHPLLPSALILDLLFQHFAPEELPPPPSSLKCSSSASIGNLNVRSPLWMWQRFIHHPHSPADYYYFCCCCCCSYRSIECDE